MESDTKDAIASVQEKQLYNEIEKKWKKEE